MLWSNGQKAIGRGAMLAVLLWTGLASAQTAPPAGAERIMVVHENGKATRCRIVESWQLPDRRMAHLLQAVDSGDRITIVDERAPDGDRNNARAMAKRIFAWGAGRTTPPKGSPIPPRMRIDSGLVLNREDAPPKDALQTNGPAIVNRTIDDQALGSGVRPDGADLKEPKRTETQVVEFNPPVSNVGVQSPPLMIPPPMNNPPPIPQVTALAPISKPEVVAPIAPPQSVVLPLNPSPPIVRDMAPPTIVEPAKRSWRPGDKLQAWLLNRSAAKRSEIVQTNMPPPMTDIDKPAAMPNAEPGAKTPVLPAISSIPVLEVKKPADLPLAISTKPAGDKVGDLPALEPVKPDQAVEKKDIWGTSGTSPAAKQPPAPSAQVPEPTVDPLFAPERITPNGGKMIPHPEMVAPVARPTEQWPLNSQSVLAARSGIQGPVTYIPYAIVTVPQPHQPPVPPDPKLPGAPQLNAFVNAFSPPPMPPGQADPGQPGMMPQGNPTLAQQQMMYQQMMQQRMMPNGDPRMASMQPQGTNSMMAPYRQPAPSSGPMANNSRQYQGPMPPNLVSGNAPLMQAGYAPRMPMMPPQQPMMPPQQPMMPPQAPTLQTVAHQQPSQRPQSPVAQQIDQLIRTMREAPYPSQREWAAQQLINFDWRANPRILHALLMSASQDPAVSVRAGCVYCLGRMDASVEPVLGALNAMRNDADPRVRQEVANTLARFTQTQAASR